MVIQRTVQGLFITTLLAMAGTAQGGSFRCSDGIASVGNTKAAVLQKCGEPVHQHSFCRTPEPAPLSDDAAGKVAVVVAPCETVDEWTFDPGKGKFMTTLRFEGGRVSAISQGERVRE